MHRIEKNVLFITHRDTIYPIGFILEDCVVLCKTVKLASISGGCFNR